MDLIDRVIAREGGAKITRDPVDPGGVTKYGISQRAHPELDIPALTYQHAKAIYQHEYLDTPGIGRIRDLYLRELVFDYAVHSGPERAVKDLQKIVGVEQDGKIGTLTLNAIDAQLARTTPVWRVYLAYIRERCLFLCRQVVARPVKVKYLVGWISRVLSI